MPFQVIVEDNFHWHDDEPERHRHGVYDTLAEAITVCQRLIDRDLAGSYREGMTADALYAQYTSFGDDPFVIDVGASAPAGPQSFSGWTYARQRSEEIVGDPQPG